MRFKQIMPFFFVKSLQPAFPKESEVLRFASRFMLRQEKREWGAWASSPPGGGEGDGRARRLVQRRSSAGSGLAVFRQPRASSSSSDSIPSCGLKVKARGGRGGSGGFTLAEVLAALLFMAIVIPVAVEGLRMANLAGQVGQRKAVAARLAEQTLHELIVTEQWRNSIQNGVLREGPLEYHWNVQWTPWLTEPFRVMTVEVTFPVQGKDYSIQLSTLIDTTMQ